MTTETGTTGAIALANTTSRLSGVAPLSVFFDATGTTATATTQPFHDLEYRWDFGDKTGAVLNLSPPQTGTSTWNMGSKPGVSSRNAATGPVSAHVYETPGTYYVTLGITDGSNTALNSCTQIIVQDPDVVFAGTNTICVAATTTPVAGNDGCPSGASVATQASFPAAISSYATTGKRVLFKHDDTFTGSTPANIAVTGPGMIGMYGSGAKPKILASSGTALVLGAPAVTVMQDWRIMDLEIDGQSNASVTGVSENGNADQITMLRLNVHDIGSGIMLNGAVLTYYSSSYDIHDFDQDTIMDCAVERAVGGAGNYIMYLYGDRLAVLGNNANDSTKAEHVTRIMHSAKAVISNNTFSNPAPTKQTFTLRGVSYSPPWGSMDANYAPYLFPYGTYAALTSQTVVSDNHFVGGVGVTQPVTVEPSDPNTYDVRFQDIILERNWYTGAGAACCWPMLGIHAQDLTVRNEIIDTTGAGEHIGIGVGSAGTHSITSNNIRIYNNTIFENDSTDDYDGPFAVQSMSGTTNITVKNNLAYFPNRAGAFFRQGWDFVTTSSNNTTSTSASPLLLAVPPTTPADFKISTGSYAIGTGAAVPVWSDFFLVPLTASRDMGAVAH